jgi:proline iminopeptidase
MSDEHPSEPPALREGYLQLERADLYYRTVGEGQPILVLHGGPEFDHTYLLPELDRFADTYRLIYYDQRGRGRSADKVRPEDVSLDSELEDLDALRRHLQLEEVALLGHSWGGLLAMEYAIRYPKRVSHLILMNTAPASHADYLLLRHELPKRREAADLEKLQARITDVEYQQGDPDTVTAYLHSHFKAAFREAGHLEPFITRLRRSFTKEGILKARAIEARLMNDTWRLNDYDLLPHLKQLYVPTLVIHGDHDFIPIECAAHIAEAIPGARFVVLKDCGHFAFIEAPDEVRRELARFYMAKS